MPVTINASPTNGLVQTADGSGIVKLQSNGVTTNALAWVNFNGSTAAIRSAYNVSSITRASTGQYTVNFTTAVSDANYCPTLAVQSRAANNDSSNYIFNNISGTVATTTPTTAGYTILCNGYDPAYVCSVVFGN